MRLIENARSWLTAGAAMMALAGAASAEPASAPKSGVQLTEADVTASNEKLAGAYPAGSDVDGPARRYRPSIRRSALGAVPWRRTNGVWADGFRERRVLFQRQHHLLRRGVRRASGEDCRRTVGNRRRHGRHRHHRPRDGAC